MRRSTLGKKRLMVNPLLRHIVVKSSGNADVPVNNLPETTDPNEFNENASVCPEHQRPRSTAVNPIQRQQQQQQMDALRESSIRADLGGIRDNFSINHK